MRNNLKKVRNNKDIGQKHLAEKLGVSVSAISQLERGKTEPSLKTVLNLADALDCYPCEIYPALSPYALSPEEIQILKTLRNMAEEARKPLLLYLQNLVGDDELPEKQRLP